MRVVPRLCEFYPGVCLKTEEKARKNLSQNKVNLSHSTKTLVTVQYTYYQKHPHITKPSQTHTLQNPLIHTLQNNIKPTNNINENSVRSAKTSNLRIFLNLHN